MQLLFYLPMKGLISLISTYKHKLHFVYLENESIIKEPIKIRNYTLVVGDKIIYMDDGKHNSIDTSNNKRVRSPMGSIQSKIKRYSQADYTDVCFRG